MPLDSVKNIILVLSGKGGVGKSSVTLQLALSLSLQGKSVGILDVDLTGPSIPRLVGKENAKITQSPQGWTPVTVHDAQPATATATTNGAGAEAEAEAGPDGQGNRANTLPLGSLRAMSLGWLLRQRSDAVIWRGPKKTAMVRQFLDSVHWGEMDYLLVDTPPGSGDENIALAESLLKLATTSTSNARVPRLVGAVLVTTPQAIAISDVRKGVNFCAKTQIPILGVIENMSGYACPCCGEVSNVFSSGGGKVMAADMGIPFLGSVPIDVKFGELVESQKIEGDTDSLDDEEMEEANGLQQQQQQQQREIQPPVEDHRPLVEKYRDCWSASIFEGFTKTLLERIKGSQI